MNVMAHAVELKDGWTPQIRYMSSGKDVLRDSYVVGEIVWEASGHYYDEAKDAVDHAQNRIDLIIKELFA